MHALRAKMAGRAGAPAEEPGAAAAWSLALARAAQDGIGLALAVTACTTARASLAELAELTPEGALIAVLAGPGGAMGMIALSPGVLAAVVERQTLGRVLAQPAQPRRATRTDAAMVAGLVDGALAALDSAVAGTDDAVWAGSFGFASCLEDARALTLILDEAAYRTLRTDVVLASGAKTGQVLIALPAAGRGRPPAPAAPPTDTAPAMAFQAALAQQVQAAPATMEAVIARVVLPLGQVMALGTGEVLRLPGATLDRIDLATLDGIRAGGGRLGQHRGMRAVRVTETDEAVARIEGSLVDGMATVADARRRTGTD